MNRVLRAYLLDRKRGPAPELAIQVSRQAGKTTSIVDVITFLMICYPPIRIGIFAPQREQAKTNFDRLKTNLNKINQATGEWSSDTSNANTLRLSNGSECYIFPVTPTSHPESKTFDLIIVEEAQGLNDHEFMNDIRPMGSSTNAPIIFIGSAGYRICYFYRLLQKQTALTFDSDRVIADKRAMYELDGDDYHLNYETFVNEEKIRLGATTDEFRVPYQLNWVLGGGQFCTREMFDPLVADYSRAFQDKQNECYVGIDTAKFPDSTVVTVIRWHKERKRKELINWMRLRGENYQDQFDYITEFLKHYNVRALAVDSTGQGDFMPDMFEKHSQWSDENNGLFRVKFTSVSKDAMYKNVLVVIQNLLTRLPRIESTEAEEFREQLLDLQREHKGELLSVHHPNSPDAHDDYPDSWALAEWAYAQSQKTGEANIRFI